MRDDLKKLPLPPEAKAYARRKGMKALKRQPQQFIDTMAAITNQRSRKHGFKNMDAAGKVPHAIKECARVIVSLLLETSAETDVQEFHVYPGASGWEKEFVGDKPGEICYNIQTPNEPIGRFVNKIWVPSPLDEKGVAAIEKRMASLAASRKYPSGSFFVAPWALYLIHGGTIGKL